MRMKITALVTARWFENTIVAVIIANSALMGLETMPAVMASFGGVISMLDRIAIAIFVVELLLKMYAFGWRFFTNGWNLFDFVVVGIALVPAGNQFSVLRALRILRALRLVSVVPRMRQVVQGLFSAIPSMGTVILLLLLVFYIGAVMATKLYGAAFPQWFGSITASLYSLFQIMTLESWSMGIVRPVMEEFPYAWVFFVPFILVTSFVVLNLFIAVIVNAMHEAADEEAGSEREAILSELKGLREDVRALHDQRSAEPPKET